MNKPDFYSARRCRLKGRRACLDNEPRISRFRALGPDWAAYDAEWLKGYDEAARAPQAPWFDADDNPYRCGRPRKQGGPCKAIVDRRGQRCHVHRDRAPHPAEQLPLWRKAA